MNLSEKFPGFEKAERPSNGLALVFDISGFTNFFNKPDIQDYITDYINQIIDCIETCIWGGEAFWQIGYDGKIEELAPMPIKPSLRKFLGDGMLYVWEDDKEKTLSNNIIKMTLMNRLWNLQVRMWKINKNIMNYMPIADLPNVLKFGLAQGSIYELTENDGSVDYIGPCINLASRLVKYCPGINIIASSRLKMNKEIIEENQYIKVIAKNLRSFEREIVLVDKNDYNKLSDSDKGHLFEDL